MGIPKGRWVDNIKIDLVETGCGGVDCIGVDQDREKRKAFVRFEVFTWYFFAAYVGC
jgi:hypothetical protein